MDFIVRDCPVVGVSFTRTGMKDTPAALDTVSVSASATGRLDATGGPVASGAATIVGASVLHVRLNFVTQNKIQNIIQ